MSKLDQLKALGAAKRAAQSNPFEDAARGRDVIKNTPEASGTARKAPSGLLLGKPQRGSARASTLAKVGDGVALTSMTHPPGLIEKIAGAIRSGKLKVSPPNPVAKATKGKAAKSNDVSKSDGVVSRLGAGRTAQDSPRLETAGAVAILKPGRPKIVEPRPWEIARMSKRTWYRRKREAEKAK
jgi:hypothetical protein